MPLYFHPWHPEDDEPLSEQDITRIAQNKAQITAKDELLKQKILQITNGLDPQYYEGERESPRL